jgi:hypothetical protein
MKHPFMTIAAAPKVVAAVAFAMMLGSAVFSAALAEDLYWVVGNRATAKCEIVTSNPVVIGDIWFADGPYKSRADAKLARSTIGACPKPESDDD